MKMTRFACLALIAMASMTTANAGGLLTNTNQNISFLRNPARDAAIGVDGVYSNPAGVIFLGKGWHFGVNWQCATQTRTVETTSPFLDHTLQATDANAPTKRYRGHASAPFVPSLQAVKNTDKWSFQFNFAVTGGGGKCDFEKGIGTFESAVGQIATQLKSLGVMGYGVDNYMEGCQYYYGITLGAAYKINNNISVYAGVRGLIASASYIAQIKDIQVSTSEGLLNLQNFIVKTSAALGSKEATADAVINQTKYYYDTYGSMYDQLKQADNAGLTTPEQKQVIQAIEGYQTAVAGKEQIATARAGLAQLDAYKDGVDLKCDQSGFGIAPIFGVDWKFGRFNLAAKYEFKTVMNLKNSSNLTTATMAATANFVDGEKVREDSPALLTIGAQYSPVDRVHINAGYHHFYDKEACKTYFTQDATGALVRNDHKNDLLSGGTNEYLGGVEVDVTDRLTLSVGGQMTRYGMTDEYMSDLSFVTNSKSLGFGAKYKANEWVTIQAGYLKTFYTHYKTANGVNDFTRTNDVIGVGCDIDL